jgi:hypothetical protein
MFNLDSGQVAVALVLGLLLVLGGWVAYRLISKK